MKSPLPRISSHHIHHIWSHPMEISQPLERSSWVRASKFPGRFWNWLILLLGDLLKLTNITLRISCKSCNPKSSNMVVLSNKDYLKPLKEKKCTCVHGYNGDVFSQEKSPETSMLDVSGVERDSILRDDHSYDKSTKISKNDDGDLCLSTKGDESFSSEEDILCDKLFSPSVVRLWDGEESFASVDVSYSCINDNVVKIWDVHCGKCKSGMSMEDFIILDTNVTLINQIPVLTGFAQRHERVSGVIWDPRILVKPASFRIRSRSPGFLSEDFLRMPSSPTAF